MKKKKNGNSQFSQKSNVFSKRCTLRSEILINPTIIAIVYVFSTDQVAVYLFDIVHIPRVHDTHIHAVISS